MGYELTDHSRIDDVVAQTTRLTNAAFADYEGAMEVDESWTEWYLQRPGTEPELCQVALDGDTVVAQVLVCAQPLQLGDGVLDCAIIDGVATHPEHRRQGLARQLMERAHEAMKERELAASVLYTNPEDHPYEFYRRLGYRERARGSLLVGPRPEGNRCAAEEVDATEHGGALRDLINDYYTGWEGFHPLDEAIWQWHRLDPPVGPATVVAELAGSGAVSTVSFAHANLKLRTRTQAVAVAYDMAATVMNEDQVRSLLSSAPTEYVAMLVDNEAPERRWAESVGLQKQVSEVAMVLPLGREASTALEDHDPLWYVMVESVIGV